MPLGFFFPNKREVLEGFSAQLVSELLNSKYGHTVTRRKEEFFDIRDNGTVVSRVHPWCLRNLQF